MATKLSFDVKKKIQTVTEYEPSAEELQQQAEAQAQHELEQQRDTNRITLEDKARAAINANRAFLASTPTNADALAQIKSLTRQVNGIIRLLVRELDDID